ncbi:baculoviral IAP repeat-containing protein 7/8 [Sarotherodon galilaeus]
MENLSRYLDINRTLTLICCFSCIFLQAEGNSTSWMVGSTVTLHCSNKSISDLLQLTWRRNGTHLFSFKPQKASNSSSVTLSSNQKTSDSRIIRSPAAATLNLIMSTLESQLYALIIESAQKSHTGNYTCETTTDFGVFEQKWELVITEEAEAGNPLKIHIATIIVPCVCFLIFIISALTFLRQVCKKQPENITQPPTVTSQVHIYENPLELEARRQRFQIQVLPYTKRTEHKNHT